MHFSLEPDTDSTAELLLFRSVKNTKDLRARLMRGEFSAAFLKPYLIIDVFQVLVAVSTALQREKESVMSTRNVFTEIVYNLSGSRNISKALQRFGVADDTCDILIAIPNARAEHIALIRDAVDGSEQTAIADGLKELSDVKQITSVYGISDQELRNAPLLDSVVSRMACRDLR